MPTILDVFISSKMVELKPERDALFALIPTLDYGDIKLHAWVFEEDAGAVGKPIRQVYLDALQNSALYLGLFWQLYGEYTIDEFDRATEWGMERHIYVKDVEGEKRDSNLTAFLNKHGDVKTGITAKWFKTTEELCNAVKVSIERWIADRLRFRAGGSSAIFAQDPDDLSEKPDKLFGRGELLTDVRVLLENKERVLLQGFAGMGKTALAATIAAQWIGDGKGNVLWLKMGSAEADALFEGLARPFNKHQEIARQVGDAKLQAVRKLLRECEASLLVLDDCWSGKDLFTLLKAVPKDMPVLATARQRYPLDEVRQVDELTPSDALALLSYHAKRSFTPSDSAADLCDLLGYHAFAVEISGKTLKVQGWTTGELLARIKDAPEQMTMPLELSEAGRENVAKLLEVSLNALDKEAKKIFLAFGAFFSPQITAEMLMHYFEEIPEVSDKLLATVQEQIPTMKDVSEDELRPQLAQFFLKNTTVASIEKGLGTLYLHGLAVPQYSETSITAYRIHDLAYSYAKAQKDKEQHHHALQACLRYTAHHNKPSLQNFARLRLELDNLMGAASWAFEVGEYAAVERFAWNLYVGSEFLDYFGYYDEATHLLQQAAEAAALVGKKGNQGAHLGNLGTAYASLGQKEKAISYFKQALTISHEIGDHQGEAAALDNLGSVYVSLGQVETAIVYHKQALTINHEIGDQRGEAISQLNLGTAHMNLRQEEKAIDYYEQARVTMHIIGDKRSEGSILGNLGVAYAELGHIEKALDYYEQALRIVLEIGDRMGEANQRNSLGTIYDEHMQDYQRALKYYQQARTLFSEMGVQDRLVTVEGNIERVQKKMGGAG